MLWRCAHSISYHACAPTPCTTASHHPPLLRHPRHMSHAYAGPQQLGARRHLPRRLRHHRQPRSHHQGACSLPAPLLTACVACDPMFKVWDCRRRTCITTVTTGSRGVYGMAIVGNELVTSVGNSLCAWDLRQLSAGAAAVFCVCQQLQQQLCPSARPPHHGVSSLTSTECCYRHRNKQRPRRGPCHGISHRRAPPCIPRAFSAA